MSEGGGPQITLKESGEGFKFLREAIDQIENAHVFVGIPEDRAPRAVPKTGEIPTNAGLLFIHTHGSEVRNIPPRPVIEPAIEADKDGLNKYLSAATNAYLEGDLDKANKYMIMVGIRGANDAKRWFKDPRNNWPRNTSETIKRKLHKALRNNPIKLKRALKTLDDAGNWGDVTSIDQTLVDYGEMKRAITFVTDLPTHTDADDSDLEDADISFNPEDFESEEATAKEIGEMLI